MVQGIGKDGPGLTLWALHLIAHCKTAVFQFYAHPFVGEFKVVSLELQELKSTLLALSQSTLEKVGPNLQPSLLIHMSPNTMIR
eukprot:1691778-Amphidinium_carterae.1